MHHILQAYHMFDMSGPCPVSNPGHQQWSACTKTPTSPHFTLMTTQPVWVEIAFGTAPY